MTVTVISDTIQEFNGTRYYLCDRYFQKDGKRLHVAVWEAANGPVPDGYHVHHRDENRARNQLDNLEALPGPEHLSLHMRQPERVEQSRENIKTARLAAAVWHGSETGRKWHSEHYQKHIAPLHGVTVKEICEHCQSEFEVSFLDAKKTKFCSNNCKAKARRKSGVDNETRACVVCDTPFVTNRYSDVKTCSKLCSSESRRRTMGIFRKK